jgi:hypothetical protein
MPLVYSQAEGLRRLRAEDQKKEWHTVTVKLRMADVELLAARAEKSRRKLRDEIAIIVEMALHPMVWPRHEPPLVDLNEEDGA